MSALWALTSMTCPAAERDELVRLHAIPGFALAAGPDHGDSFDLCLVPQTKMHAMITGAEIAPIRVDPSEKRFFTGAEYIHLGSNAKAVLPRRAQSHLQPIAALGRDIV